MESKPITKAHIEPLTTLRAVAALLVFLHHFYPFPHPPGLMTTIARQGFFGVSIFFTLSAFLITLRYYDRFTDTARLRANLSDFMFKRFARIYPLYLVIFLVALIIGERSVNGYTGFIQVALLQSYFEGMASVVPTSWSLTVELTFYLAAPFVLWTCAIAAKRVQDGWQQIIAYVLCLGAWTVILLALGLGMRALSMRYLSPTELGYQFLPTAGYMLNNTLNGYFAVFAAGIVTALVILKTNWLDRVYQSRNVSLVLCVVSFGVMLLLFHLSETNDFRQHELALYLTYAVLAVFTCTLIVGLMNPDHIISRVFSWRWFVYLGYVSYAFYLLQMTPIVDAARMPSDAIFPDRTPMWVYLPLLYLLSNIVSAVFYELSEKPAQQALLHWWNNSSQSARRLLTPNS